MLSIKNEAIEIDKNEAITRLEATLHWNASRGGRTIRDFLNNEMKIEGAYQDSRSPNDEHTWSYVHGIWRLFDKPMVGQAKVIARIGWERPNDSDNHDLQVLVTDYTDKILTVVGYHQQDQFYTSPAEAFGYNVKNVAEVTQTFTKVVDLYRQRAELLRDVDRVGGLLD